MATLKFGNATSIKGFTSHETASFNDVPPARIVRELIQNSQDAAVEAGEPTAVVRFRVEQVGHKEMPDIGGYRNAFDMAVDHWTTQNGGKLTDAAQEVVNRIERGLEALNDGDAVLLSVMDNGVGLDVKRMNSLLSDGASEKRYDMSGSYGVGHLAPMALSDLRYLLYGGQTKDGRRIACGRTILASHPGKKTLMTAEGYLIKSLKDGLDGNLYEFLSRRAHPKIIADRIDEINAEWGHGCAVVIPAFNNFTTNDRSLWDIVSKVAAYNFCPAIQQSRLAIEVCDSNGTQTLDKNTLVDILSQESERVRAARRDSFFAGLRPSGQNAYSVLQTLSEGKRDRVQVTSGLALVNIMCPSLNGQTRVDLFRNGMWITDEIPGLQRADFANLRPFHAVIEVAGVDSNELHRLVRKAEGPMHDQLSLSLLSTSERKTVGAALEEIADWIREAVPPIGTDEYTVDDFLMVKAGQNAAAGRASFSFWGIPTVVERRINRQIETDSGTTEIGGGGNGNGSGSGGGGGSNGGGTGTGTGRDRVRQQRTNRQAFRSVVIPNGNGSLIASFISERDFSEALFTLHVDENTDFTCDRIWQDDAVSIKSIDIKPVESKGNIPGCEIASDKRSVKVTDLVAKANYEVQVEYDAPQELVSTVGVPVLRLELHTPVKQKAKP
jgi:uncharacterized membrane protein YgcG